MNSNMSVAANFIKKQYPLNIEIEGAGTVKETVIKEGLARIITVEQYSLQLSQQVIGSI